MAACGASNHIRWKQLCDKPRRQLHRAEMRWTSWSLYPTHSVLGTLWGRLVKVYLIQLLSLFSGSGQRGLVKHSHSANSSPVLGASGVGHPGSDTKALCISWSVSVWVSEGRSFHCPYVCKWRGSFRGREPGFWSHLFLILGKRW